MKKAGIVINTKKPDSISFSRDISLWLENNGCSAEVSDERKEGDIFSESDFLVVLGGDGTMLRAAAKAAINDIPIIGFNLGRLGYLTDAEKSGAFTSLSKLLAGEYKTEKRMMLKAEVFGAETKSSNIALNEVVIAKGVLSKMIAISLTINGKYIDSYRADGIIISTPTGSTAYNLSAGGPILEPDSEMIAITFICPHMIYARPFVVSASDVIDLRISENKRNDAVLTLDGGTTAVLNDGQNVIIEKSKYYTTTIRTTGMGFYDILRQKMVGQR